MQKSICKYCKKEIESRKSRKYCSTECFKADKENVIRNRKETWSNRDEEKKKEVSENISKALKGRKQTEQQKAINPFCKKGQPEIKKAMLEKYGVENCQQIKEVQEKTKRTCKEKYGVNYAIHSENSINAIKEKYGVDHISQDPDIKQRKKISERNTCLKKYGTTHVWQVPAIRAKIKETFDKTIRSKRYDRFIENKNNWNYAVVLLNDKEEFVEHGIMKCLCKTCGKEFNNEHFIYTNEPRCLDCFPVIERNLIKETMITKYIETLGYSTEKRNNLLGDKRELDIYIEEKKLAIEFNGTYFHSEKFKDRNYHLNKTLDCLAQGIRLIHIWEFDWIEKREIIESRLKSILGLNERIMARKCKIIKINNSEANKFLDVVHLQGGINAKQSYGLYYNNELVAVASFGSSRFAKNEMELLRYSSKLNVNIAGGLSRLCRYFILNNNCDNLVSYCSRDWGEGEGYVKAGFVKVGEVGPGYKYWNSKTNEISSRFNFQKHKILELWPDVDPKLTEHGIMLNKGFLRIYDTGNIKYKWDPQH